jgi:hypothetical protein
MMVPQMTAIPPMIGPYLSILVLLQSRRARDYAHNLSRPLWKTPRHLDLRPSASGERRLAPGERFGTG